MKKNKIDMLNGSILKNILMFALPMMLSSLLQFNYSLVDNIIVGRYVSSDALAAVGNVMPINSFIIGAALGLTSGFTIPVAQSFGAGDQKKVSHYAGSSIVVAGLTGLIIVITGHLLSTPLLKLINTPAGIIELSSAYVNILYFGVPIQMLSNDFTALSRAVGESKKPLYFFSVSVLVNFCLDLLFVKTFGWGVEGAAIATLISHIVAATLNGIYIFKFNKDLHITLKDLRLNKSTVWKQIKLGIPVSLQFTITSIGSMSMQRAINGFGGNIMAGLTAANKVENLTNIPMSALGGATQTFSGQNYGAKNYDRIRRGSRRIVVLELFLSVVMSVILYLISEPILSLFMSDINPEMMEAGKRYILAICQCYSLVALLFVLRNVLQGLGFTYANAIAGAGELIGRISIAFIFSKIIGFTAICYAPPAAWLLADIPLVFIYIIKMKKFKKLSVNAAQSSSI